MSIWMTRFDWRTCKRDEVEVIRGYLFESWIREYQEQEQRELQQENDADATEIEERSKYGRARNTADRFGN